jgi:hypothetical protein
MSTAAVDLDMAASVNVEAMSPAQAAAKLSDLMNSDEWREKYLAGSGPAVRSYNELAAKKAEAEADERLDAIVAGTAEPPWLEMTTGGQITTRAAMQTAEQLRGFGMNDEQIKQVLSGARVSRAEYDAIKLLRADRMGNRDWTTKLLAGDFQAGREFALMNTVIANGYREEKSA